MPAVHVNEENVHEFEDPESFYAWLSEHHATSDELWIKLHKVGSGRKSITPKEAIDVVLCWGWIDAIRKRFDEQSYLQRYVPRRPKSLWSKVNVGNVARLIDEGRMTEHGLKQVELAKADGRWQRAYAGSREMVVPEDLRAAIAAVPEAQAAFERLSSQNRYAILFRLSQLKTEAGRKKRMAEYVSMLGRGETIYPQSR
ncbi:MAG TPA: YdeI/OmpD-associated family protein [Trueperaceae bacterium]|nr:YdeI/OmpD-associated family protein [Trueperaceae bacterium]